MQTYSVRKQTVLGYKTRPNKFEALRESFKTAIGKKNYPLLIGFHFIRGTRHKCDFHNIVQIIADLMVAHKFIDDDNMDCFLPYPLEIEGKYYSYDKENPGAIIKIN